MKKRIFSIGSIIILSILLIACSDNEEVENPPQNDTSEDNQQQTEQNNTDTTNETDSDSNSDSNTEYGFTNFDLEVDYAKLDDALDVDYENETDDKMEASYHFRSEGFDLKGDEAMEELDSIFSSFKFDENTSNEDVINEVAEAFNIPEDAKKIELDIEFSNGTEKEYQR